MGDRSATTKTRARAEKFAHRAMAELADDGEGLQILLTLVRALATRSRRKRRPSN